MERLRELVDYDPSTGVFTWRPMPPRPGRQAPVGIAGKLDRAGYLAIAIDRKYHRAHRLAWLHHYGEWPTHGIDHFNGIRTDNRIANLRDVPASVNNQNRHQPRRNNRSGLVGVNTYPNGRFTSSIKYDGKQHHLGTFTSAEDAHRAYLEAKAKHHKGSCLFTG